MAALSYNERRRLEKFLGMSSGYVLDFSDRTFEEFVRDAVGVNIHDEKYTTHGTSKANKLRRFWEVEDDYTAGRLLDRLIDYGADDEADKQLTESCKQIVSRLLTGGPGLSPVKTHAEILNAGHLKEQIRRLEESVQADPSLAIGTAKELIETYCRTILSVRGVEIDGVPDLSTLTKRTFKELKLVPDGVPEAARGSDVIRRILSNLATIGHGMAELRGLYGTGHGRHGTSKGLQPRHARLAVGASIALVVFLFETHEETKEK